MCTNSSAELWLLCPDNLICTEMSYLIPAVKLSLVLPLAFFSSFFIHSTAFKVIICKELSWKTHLKASKELLHKASRLLKSHEWLQFSTEGLEKNLCTICLKTDFYQSRDFDRLFIWILQYRLLRIVPLSNSLDKR